MGFAGRRDTCNLAQSGTHAPRCNADVPWRGVDYLGKMAERELDYRRLADMPPRQLRAAAGGIGGSAHVTGTSEAPVT